MLQLGILRGGNPFLVFGIVNILFFYKCSRGFTPTHKSQGKFLGPQPLLTTLIVYKIMHQHDCKPSLKCKHLHYIIRQMNVR